MGFFAAFPLWPLQSGGVYYILEWLKWLEETCGMLFSGRWTECKNKSQREPQWHSVCLSFLWPSSWTLLSINVQQTTTWSIVPLTSKLCSSQTPFFSLCWILHVLGSSPSIYLTCMIFYPFTLGLNLSCGLGVLCRQQIDGLSFLKIWVYLWKSWVHWNCVTFDMQGCFFSIFMYMCVESSWFSRCLQFIGSHSIILVGLV